jgi:hypothetical protein
MGEGEQEQVELETENQNNTPNMSSMPGDDSKQPTQQENSNPSGDPSNEQSNEQNFTPAQPELTSEPQNGQADEKEDTPAQQPEDEVYGPPLPEGGLPTDPQEVLENLPEDELKNASEDLPEMSSEPQDAPADEQNSSQIPAEQNSSEPQDGPINTGNEGEPVNGGENPAPANTNQPPAPAENGNGGEGGAPPANVGGMGGAGGLIDKELAENKRASVNQPQDPQATAQSIARDSWSGERLAFVLQNVGIGGATGFGTGAALGAATGVTTRLAERGALYAAQKWGPKIASNAAKVTPVPAVGAVIGGGLAAYALYNKWKDRENIYKSITSFGQGEDVFEVLANSLDSIGNILDIVSASLNVIAGLAGLFAIGAWVAAVVTGGVLSPLAGAATALAAGIGLATTVLDLINTGIGSLVLVFRSLHALNQDFASPEAAIKAGQDLQKAASGPLASMGAFAGGKATQRGKAKQQAFDDKVSASAVDNTAANTPPASQGPQITANIPASNTPPADANATAPNALPVAVPPPTNTADAPTPASLPDTPTPASLPDMPTPASKPDTPTPASKPDTPTPASKPDTPTPASKPDIPTSQQTGVQNPDGGGIFTGAQNSRKRNEAREDFKQITEQDIDTMLNNSLNPENPNISVPETPVPKGYVGTPKEKPNFTDKEIDAMLNNAFDPTHPDTILVGGDAKGPASTGGTADQNPVSSTPMPEQGPVSSTPMPEQGPVSSTNAPDPAPASNANAPDPATSANPPPQPQSKNGWLTPEQLKSIEKHQTLNEKMGAQNKELAEDIKEGNYLKSLGLGWASKMSSETAGNSPAGFGANTPAGQQAGFDLDKKFDQQAKEEEEKKNQKKSVQIDVQPAYTPPPATPQDVQTLNQEAQVLGLEEQNSNQAFRYAQDQENEAKSNQEPLKAAIETTQEGVQNTTEHATETNADAEKNKEKGTEQESANTEISGSQDTFSQLDPFISLIRGFLGYMHLAEYLPDGVAGEVLGAAGKARNIVESIDEAKAKVADAGKDGPAQKAKIESDASTLDDVKSQNADTASQFEEAQASYEQSQTENEQMLSNAQESKEKASSQREQISEQKNSTENEAVEMQSSIDQWAAEQAAIRAQALQNASIQAQTQGFEVTAVQDIP